MDPVDAVSPAESVGPGGQDATGVDEPERGRPEHGEGDVEPRYGDDSVCNEPDEQPRQHNAGSKTEEPREEGGPDDRTPPPVREPHVPRRTAQATCPVYELGDGVSSSRQ